MSSMDLANARKELTLTFPEAWSFREGVFKEVYPLEA